MKDNSRIKNNTLSWLFGIAVFLMFLCVVLIFPGYVIKDIPFLEFKETGQIGDTIGGIMGPIIGIVATIVTFLAFWIQYEANEQQRTDLKIERFENKFFEMLKLHKENVNEMSIEGYDSNNIIKKIVDSNGRDVFEESDEKVIRHTNGRDVFIDVYNELRICHEICKTTLLPEDFEGKERYLIKLSYKLVFSGVSSNWIESNDSKIENDKEYVNRCKTHLLMAARKHINSYGKEKNYTFPGTNYTIRLSLKYPPFSGRASIFGHYYRHLYFMVKYVVQQPENVLNLTSKKEYLKILRAQMNGHEQLLLYYNYLSGYGKNWENKTNKFFSDFRMIHNLPMELTKFSIDPYVEFKEQIETVSKTGVEMFEYDEV